MAALLPRMMTSAERRGVARHVVHVAVDHAHEVEERVALALAGASRDCSSSGSAFHSSCHAHTVCGP